MVAKRQYMVYLISLLDINNFNTAGTSNKTLKLLWGYKSYGQTIKSLATAQDTIIFPTSFFSTVLSGLVCSVGSQSIFAKFYSKSTNSSAIIHYKNMVDTAHSVQGSYYIIIGI